MNVAERAPALAPQLAALVARTVLSDIPDDVLTKVKAHILDQIGVQLVGSLLPGTAPVRNYVERFGAPGDCSVTGMGIRRDAEYASLLNATLGHGFEMDDYAPRAFTHPGCEALPAAVSAAEEVDATGVELLRAVALGFELTVRLGLVTMPSMLLDRGFHENCTHGAIASSVAAGILHRLSEDQQVMAISIAASHASGTTEYAQTGGDVKRIHAGLGAMAAIRSVRLAQLGFTGPRTILEGRRGFFQAFTDHYDPDLLLAGWGEQWQFMRYGAIKPHFCVGSIHAHLEALDLLRREAPIDPAEVEEIVLGVDPLTKIHAGSVGPEPTDIVGAQFSAEYSLALNLVRGGNGLREYQEVERAGFKDADVLEISRRVRVVDDAECAAQWPEAWLGRVTIRTKDGRERSTTAYGKGTPYNPMTLAEVTDKYRKLAAERVPAERAAKIESAVMGVERLASARELTRLLAVS